MNRRISRLALTTLGTGLIVAASVDGRGEPAPVDQQAVDRYLAQLETAADPHPAQREVSSLGAKLEGARPVVDSALTAMH